MKASRIQDINVNRSDPPMIACHNPVVIGMNVGTGHCSARQRSVKSVSTPTVVTILNARCCKDMGALRILNRYRTSEVVQARTMRARLVRNSENPKNFGTLVSMGAKQKIPIQHCSIVTWIS